MQKRGKAQAALEFLLTYGWVIMTVLAAIGALAYYGTLNPDQFLPSRCNLKFGVVCVDFKVQENEVTIVLLNGKREELQIPNINVTGCSGTASGILKYREQKKFTIGGCSNIEGLKFIGDLNITYIGKSNLTHKNVGKIIAKVESGCALCACQNIETDCGSYPNCENCNNFDSHSANYCNGNNIVRDFNDYSCSSNQCVSSMQQQTVENCISNNGICQSAQCICSGSSSSCGTYPSCSNCGANNGECQSNNCICTGTDSSCGAYPSCNNCGTNNGICQSNNCACEGTGSSCGAYPNCAICSQVQACQDNQCILAIADFSASYSNLCQNCNGAPPGFGSGNWWYFDTTLRENGGIVGITVTQRQKCYSSPVCGSFCDPVRTDIAEKYGTNYIPPGGQIIRINDWVWFVNGCGMVKTTETFWGTDNNNNNLQTNYNLTVNSG